MGKRTNLFFEKDDINLKCTATGMSLADKENTLTATAFNVPPFLKGKGDLSMLR